VWKRPAQLEVGARMGGVCGLVASVAIVFRFPPIGMAPLARSSEVAFTQLLAQPTPWAALCLFTKLVQVSLEAGARATMGSRQFMVSGRRR